MPLQLLGIVASGANVSATSFESIATVSVGSGGAANVEFTSIPGTYSHLQVRGIGRSTQSTTSNYISLQFNSDTGSNYTQHQLSGDGATAAGLAFTTISQIYIQRITGANATASVFGTVVLDILDYANANKYKTVRALGGFDLNGSGEIYFHSGLWQNTNAITSLKLTPASNNFAQYSHFALYGIKGAA